MAKAKTIATQAHAAAQPEGIAEAESMIPQATAAAPSLSKGKTVKARVLSACAYGQPNDVVEIDAADAASLSGVVDTDPSAVAYAESIKAGTEE